MCCVYVVLFFRSLIELCCISKSCMKILQNVCFCVLLKKGIWVWKSARIKGIIQVQHKLRSFDNPCGIMLVNIHIFSYLLVVPGQLWLQRCCEGFLALAYSMQLLGCCGLLRDGYVAL